MILCVCVWFPTGVALDFPLVGGECVWQFGWHHSWLEPAAPALTEPWVQRCDGVSQPQVVTVSFDKITTSADIHLIVWIMKTNIVVVSGPMMKLVYKLQAEEYKYEIPVNYLPVRTSQSTLRDSSALWDVIPFLYYRKLIQLKNCVCFAYLAVVFLFNSLMLQPEFFS